VFKQFATYKIIEMSAFHQFLTGGLLSQTRLGGMPSMLKNRPMINGGYAGHAAGLFDWRFLTISQV